MTDAADAVHTTISGGGAILEVTLDRPKANAINAETSREMSRVFAGFRDDPDLRVAILTGGGDRFFSAGWDLNAAADGEAFEADYGEGGFGGFVELPRRTKPVICAVNGMAVGGGFEIAMAAEFVIAAEHARFWLPEAGLGIIPDAGIIRLPRQLPPMIANEVLYAGRRMESDEALRWGLVNSVVPADELMDAARELAGRILGSAPLAVASMMEIDQATGHLPLRDAFRTMRSGELPIYQAMLASEDAAAGPANFGDDGPPQWKGR